MCSCEQSLVNLAFLWEKLSQPQFYKDLTRKPLFWGVVLVQVQKFGTGTRYKLEISHQCGNWVKTKSQKVLGVNSYVCRSYRGKTGGWVRGVGFLFPPLSWIGLSVFIQSHSELNWNLFTLIFEVLRRSFWLFCEVNKTRFTLLFNRIYGLHWKTWVCLESFE